VIRPDAPVLLEIRDLHARGGQGDPQGREPDGACGEIHAVMGRNGSGKSTLSKVLAGHPAYTVTGGSVRYRGENLLELDPEQRARHGVFLGFQYPVEIPGVSNLEFLRVATNARRAQKGEEELDTFAFEDHSCVSACRWCRWIPPSWIAGERRLQRRREKAQRDPADGPAGSRGGDPR
jgi:Fe-S cluster assembly ATP-binding protein